MYDVRRYAIDALRVLRKTLKYRELEVITGLSTPALWRYVNMRILPTKERAKELLDKLLSDEVVKMIIKENIEIIDDSIVSTSNLIYNVDFLRIFALVARKVFEDLEPTAIATVEVDGIPLAVAVSEVFDAKLVVAKRRIDIGVSNYHEVSYISRDPPSVVNLYIPSNILDRRDRVLIVDDLLRSGRTSQALIRLIRKAKATPVGLYAILALGNRWYSALENEVSKIHVSYIIE
ncbi:MAG: phosphoribosyltransferase family protein [Sulfolobales archaeon]